MRLYIAQTRVCTDEDQSIRQLEEILRRAKAQGAELTALPEMWCCPYVTTEFPRYAQPQGGSLYRKMSALAAKYELLLAAGTVPESEENSSGTRIYNTCYVFGRSGELLAKHRKMHLFDIHIEGGQHFMESETLTAGDQITVFDTPFGRIGLCICFDFRFPEPAMLMADKGARLFLVPAAFNPTTGPAHWELMFRQRAVDNQVFCVGIAPALDPSASYHSYGHSIVADPWGRVLLQMGTAEEEQLIDVDLSQTESIRRQLPLLSARRKDIYTLKEI